VNELAVLDTGRVLNQQVVRDARELTEKAERRNEGDQPGRRPPVSTSLLQCARHDPTVQL
jgi:hypothetical protein